MTQRLFLSTFTLLILLSLSHSAFITGVYSDPFLFPDETGLVVDTKTPVKPTCANAITKANRAMTKLVEGLKAQASQWTLYSEFDAVDEASYYLKTRCKAKHLDLINAGETGLNATQDIACEKLMGMFVSLLGKKEAASFEGTFEGGISMKAKAKILGRLLGDNCKPVLVAKKVSETDASLAGSVKDFTKSAIDESIAAQKMNLRIGTNFQKKGIDLVFGADKADDGKEGISDEIESEETL